MNAPEDAQAALVKFASISKRFGEIAAVSEASFTISPGEVLALVGENGAGKSTIVNMLGGLLQPDSGEILVKGNIARFTSPVAAVRAGIGVVHQHYALVPTLTALENIALGMTELGPGLLNRADLGARIAQVSDRLGFRIAEDAPVETLDVAQQQQVEIVKALIHEVDILLLDEPTAVLAANDTARLFETIRKFASRGSAIVLVTHKLEDVFEIADRTVVMRQGRVVEDRATNLLTADEIVSAMIGSSLSEGSVKEGPQVAAKPRQTETLARLHGVGVKRTNGSSAVTDVNLELRAGEIVALAGVDGNGQSELVLAMAGIGGIASGEIECLGLSSASRHWHAAELRARGLVHIPEDRHRHGVVDSMSLVRNYQLTDMPGGILSSLGLLGDRAVERRIAPLLSRFAVKCNGPRDRMDMLSGGNQQKVVLSRELDANPKLILAAHPSRGLDIKTIRMVHVLLDEMRSRGCGILLVSADIDEILDISDRVMAFASGRAEGPFERHSISRQQLGALIAGHGAAA